MKPPPAFKCSRCLANFRGPRTSRSQIGHGPESQTSGQVGEGSAQPTIAASSHRRRKCSKRAVDGPAPSTAAPAVPTSSESKPAGDRATPPAGDAKPDGEPALRTWTDSSGKFKIEAQCLGVADGKVQLRKADGKVVSIALEKLSQADRDFLSPAARSQSSRPRKSSRRSRSLKAMSRRTWTATRLK